MALTKLQRRVCRLVAERRRGTEGSYVGGGVALNESMSGQRISRDLDLFHDTREAVAVSSREDQIAFRRAGLSVEVLRDLPGFIEVLLCDEHGDGLLVEWLADSAFRFFPLIPHEELGVTLHPVDLATNKVCALVGRVEVRDWIDTIACHQRIQPLGYLAWAACGKDAGLNPMFILSQAARTARYSRAEVEALAFEGPAPDVVELSQVWRSALQDAQELVELLPAELAGSCVLHTNGDLFRGNASDLKLALNNADLVFHPGAIRGALPVLRVR